MKPRIVVESLSGGHDRSAFASGVAPLDRYFGEQVTQDVRRRLTNCFVAVDSDNRMIVGYYTFAAASISVDDLPIEDTRRLPRYPTFPAGLTGRLAIDQRCHRQGFGAALLADAVLRAMRADPAIFALLVDAKDDRAAAFYRTHGFRALANRPLTLFLSVATAQKLLGGAGA